MGETAPRFNGGDVVWVKLGPAWWPGEVTDPANVPEEIVSNLKRPPLVIVKFFDEETYEYVKNWTHIYPYNCDKKNEFIKKGMASFRKAAHMGKFPKDVSLAEVKTGGNANILSDPMFLPEQKRSSTQEMGTPSPKKRPKLSTSSAKSKPSTSKVNTSHITHRRFLGFDDYEAFICIQYPGKDRDGESEDEELRNINNEPEEDYNCHSCPFKTRRLEVMIRHTRSHIQGDYMEAPKARKYKLSSRKQMRQKRSVTGEDSLTDSEESDRDLNSSVEVTKKEEKRTERVRPRKPRKPKVIEILESESEEEKAVKEKIEDKKVTTVMDIRNNLLAEWEDSDEESVKTEEVEQPKGEEKPDEEIVPKAKETSTTEQIKSCFDFDEEEEDEEIAAPSTTGRKIPRVIPEKRKSQDDDIDKDAILKESESFNREGTSKEVDLEFESLMESTEVPDLPEIQNTLKAEQNFHDTKTVKFPDKEDKRESEVATKLTNPKKRFVKSFEDFELEMRRKLELENMARTGREDPFVTEDSMEAKSFEEVSSNFEETSLHSEETTISDFVSKTDEEAKEETRQQSDSSEPKNDETAEELPKPSSEEDAIPDSESKNEELSVAAPQNDSYESEIEDVPIPAKTIPSSEETVVSIVEDSSKNLEETIPTSEESVAIEEAVEIKSAIEDIIPVEETIEPAPQIEEVVQQEETQIVEEDVIEDRVPERSPEIVEEGKLSDLSKTVEEENKAEDLPKLVVEESRGEDLQKSNEESAAEDLPQIVADSPKIIEESVPEGLPKVIDNTPEELQERPDQPQTVDDKPEEPAMYEGTSAVLEAQVVHEQTSTTSEEQVVHEETSTIPEEQVVREETLNIPEEQVVREETSTVPEEIKFEETIQKHPKLRSKRLRESRRKSELQVNEEPVQVVEIEIPESEKESPNIEQPKRKRGRLSVEKHDETPQIEESNILEAPVKRRRGRPPKKDKRILLSEEIEPVEETPIVLEDKTNNVTECAKSAIAEDIAPLKKRIRSISSQKIEEAVVTPIETHPVEVKKEESKLITPPKKKRRHRSYREDSTEDNLTPAAVLPPTEENVVVSQNEEVKEMPVVSKEEALSLTNEAQVRSIRKEETPEIVEEVVKYSEENVVLEEPALVVEEKEEHVITEDVPIVTDEISVSAEHFQIAVEDIPLPKDDPPAVKHHSSVIAEPVIEETPLVTVETPVVSFEEISQTSREETEHVVHKQIIINEEKPLILEETVEEPQESEAKREEAAKREESVSAEEQSSDMNEEVSSVDSFRDEFSSVGNASLELPEDAIWAPPKKKNRRGKTTEDNMMDMFFNFDKKVSNRNKLEEAAKTEEPKSAETADKKVDTPVAERDEDKEHRNEMEVKVGNNGEEEDFKFCIQTNLTNFSKAEEMSALTLAALSEIQEEKKRPPEDEKQAEDIPGIPIPLVPESELVQIEGNLTVVSEKDLADGQVEITSDKVISPKKSTAAESTTKVGTEIPEKALTLALDEPIVEKAQKKNAYGRLELLDILEGNSNSNSSNPEQTFKDSFNAYENKNVVQGICDFEECIPSQIVRAMKVEESPVVEEPKVEPKKGRARIVSSKLLEKLNEPKPKPKITIQSDVKVTAAGAPKTTVIKSHSKFVIKTTKPPASTGNKPIILSEQIIKPASDVRKLVKHKRSLADIEDVEAFVIHKGPKMVVESSKQGKSKSVAGKAKILNQTIITAQGEIIQPSAEQPTTDDNVFDINSMPIVLSDEILTPESIENMPIVLEGDRPSTSKVAQQNVAAATSKTVISMNTKTPKKPRLLQSGKLAKPSPPAPHPAKSGKYIIIPSAAAGGTPQARGAAPKAVVKRGGPAGKLISLTPASAEPIGNKIMIVTNQQGQQQRLLLTPAQQKLLQLQSQAVAKREEAQASARAKTGATQTKEDQAGPSGAAATAKAGDSLTAVTAARGALIKSTLQKKIGQKTYTPKTQKTILIKNQRGETVTKIQGTDDAELDKQVAEQLEAIKASARLTAQSKAVQQENVPKPAKTPPVRKASYPRKAPPAPQQSGEINKTKNIAKIDSFAPPLAPITQKKPAEVVQDGDKAAATPVLSTSEQKLGRPLNQLVIQDAMGVQTTITEGQIVAFPSETVDGQPQSYMLVTLDEHGNLTPLNNEALMSLDPSLGLGVDLNNMVLQIDQGQGALAIVNPDSTLKKPLELLKHQPEPDKPDDAPPAVAETAAAVKEPEIAEPAAPPGGQQLILTGDPAVTQKFLESLSDGSTDLSNILANSDGGNIIIHADGQQILINTSADSSLVVTEPRSEDSGNPVFATKSQDILAAALADTDVLQPEPQPIKSQLSPNGGLYPMNVGNVLETSLTLSSPIMTPLEVPSTNSKRVDDEADILSQVPKNVDLPITVTDPSIAQAASLMGGGLELGADTTPYVYSLPALDQKPFNNSMPLLTEDVVEETRAAGDKKRSEYEAQLKSMELETEGATAVHAKTGEYIDEGLCTLGGEMCSSLSEPPPDMFDLAGVGGGGGGGGGGAEKDEEASSDLSSAQGETSSVNSSEGSCEIPVQPRIVAKLSELERTFDEDEDSANK